MCCKTLVKERKQFSGSVSPAFRLMALKKLKSLQSATLTSAGARGNLIPSAPDCDNITPHRTQYESVSSDVKKKPLTHTQTQTSLRFNLHIICLILICFHSIQWKTLNNPTKCKTKESVSELKHWYRSERWNVRWSVVEQVMRTSSNRSGGMSGSREEKESLVKL